MNALRADHPVHQAKTVSTLLEAIDASVFVEKVLTVRMGNAEVH